MNRGREKEKRGDDVGTSTERTSVFHCKTCQVAHRDNLFVANVHRLAAITPTQLNQSVQHNIRYDGTACGTHIPLHKYIHKEREREREGRQSKGREDQNDLNPHTEVNTIEGREPYRIRRTMPSMQSSM